MIELAGGEWRAILLPEQGGAFAALTFCGLDVLVPLPAGADPNASFAGAFLMAPWTNRLDAGRFGDHRLVVNRPSDNTAIHGLSREQPWQVASATPASARLTQRLVQPPFDYCAELSVTLDGAGLRLTLALTNLAAETLPMGMGWHPFFHRPAGTRLRFAAAALLARDARNLPLAAEPSTGVDGTEPAYEGLDTHFSGWDGALTIARPDLTLRLQASGAWAGNLQVFAPSGSEVLCAEPVSHIPDAPNRPALASVHGALAPLAPGETLSAALSLVAAPAGG